MRTITQRQLRNESPAILRQAPAGEHRIVIRNGTPVAEMRPVPARCFVSRAVLAAAARRAPRIDRHRFREDLVTMVNQDVLA